MGEVECTEIKSCVIDWKAGKNVTVELTAKKTKGGGAKKAKQKAKAKEEPRASWFRFFFRNLKKGDPAPDDIPGMDMEDVEDEDEITEQFLAQLEMAAGQIKEVVVKYAIR